MKRFLIFGWHKKFIPPGPSHNSPTGYWKTQQGGWFDFIMDIDNISDLPNLILIAEKLSKYDEAQIIDTKFPDYAKSGLVNYLTFIQDKKDVLIDYIISNTLNEDVIDVRKWKFK